jgi:isopentenyldiphosphate isomerase
MLLARKMADEIFDVVDAGDQVIGRAPRAEVHERGLMHRATHVLVFNAKGDVFLQKRSMKKDRQPGVWDSSASGHLNAGEDYDSCAVRELEEEIGLTCVQPRRLFKLAASPDTDQEHVWIYRCEAEGPFRLDPEEIETGGWFSHAQVDEWMKHKPEEFASALLVIWQRVRAMKAEDNSGRRTAA